VPGVDGPLVPAYKPASAHKPFSAHKPASVTTGLMAALADPCGFTVFAVAFSPDGRTLATGGGNGRTYLWYVR